jgi:peptidoglycan/LPS O-acetylase OafA/YrhL
MYGSSLFLVDVIKALASQLIVWHHLVAYSPMSNVLRPQANGLFDWLYADARLAVQAFLVVGGFLAARSLVPHPGAVATALSGTGLLHRLWSRYLRLSLPYVIALAFAIACAALARGMADDPNTPAAPTAMQVLAHVALLQDIVNVDALSAGVWYVAIDFQLYALFASLLWLVPRLARLTRSNAGYLAMALCGGLTAASLFWVNRDRSMDLWAPYFFGSYGLGVFAQWASHSSRKAWWMAAMASLVLVALVIDWRSRILLAGLIALMLAGDLGTLRAPQGWSGSMVSLLSRISYPVFLIHYPVSLLAGVLILGWESDSIGINAVALFATWLLSLGAGALLHYWTERGVLLPGSLPRRSA